MKPSHYTTPRTLAECQWTTGYQGATHALDDRRGVCIWDWAIAAVAGAVAVLIWMGAI